MNKIKKKKKKKKAGAPLNPLPSAHHGPPSTANPGKHKGSELTL